MSLVRLNNRVIKNLKRCRLYATAISDEYSETPEYPPIVNNSIEHRRLRQRQARSDEVQKVKTVEEKQIKLNMPKYYGYHTYLLTEDVIPYNGLPMVQHFTRTHLIKQQDLPEYYNKINFDDSVVGKVSKEIEEVILLEFDQRKHYHNELESVDVAENKFTKLITRQINRVILNNLVSRFPHVLDTQVDEDAKHEAFWFVGGIDPTENMRRSKKGVNWMEKYAEDPVDRPIQYKGQPTVSLRHVYPLLPVMPYSDCDNPSLTFPSFKYDPRVLYHSRENRYGTNIPGFWPGDHSEFGLLSYHKRGHLADRPYGHGDRQETLHCQAISASFGWLLGQASYKGFTTYNDVTYPMVAQTIITNGQLWSFYVYQLNTLLMHGPHFHENPKRNVCWATPELKLFEKLDPNTGKLIGFNEDVLKTLLKFYHNAPEERLGLNLTPYLSQHEKRIADYENDEKRDWLEKQYKHIMSNRPRHKLPYEIYHWEKIYKIDHKTRPMDKKRRPFELFQNPWNRKLDEYPPEYIPKDQRPEGLKSKIKFKKTYYP